MIELVKCAKPAANWKSTFKTIIEAKKGTIAQIKLFRRGTAIEFYKNKV